MASLTTALQSLGLKSFTAADPVVQQLAKVRSGSYPGLSLPVNITPEIQAAVLRGEIEDPLKGYSRPSSGFDAIAQKFITPAATALFGAVAGWGLSGALSTGVTGLTKLATDITAPRPTLAGGSKMSFADGDSGFNFNDFFGGVGNVLQGGLGQSLLGLGTQAASGFISQQFSPQPVSYGLPGANMAAAGAIARTGAVVGRSFFNKFPNLAAAIQGLRDRGANVTRAKLYGLMKRFGPDFLVTGGILTAAAVSELAMAGPGRRRVNPGNVKALRRAHRRMKSFHRVCQTNDHLLHARRRRAAPANFGGTRITQVK